MESLSGPEFTRLVNNFYNQNNISVDLTRIDTDARLFNYVGANRENAAKKFKVAFCYICVNPTYWEYVKPMVDGAKQFFLPGHEVDFFFWTDMPKLDDKDSLKKAEEFLLNNTTQRYLKFGRKCNDPETNKQLNQEATEDINRAFESVKTAYDNHVFPIEPIEWPMPTLLRYHTFLQQEETLRKYDYAFYCDVDMRFVNIVGDEILSEGLTAALHPMYALDKTMWMPYEPNEKSTAFIPRPGQVIDDNGQLRFMPMYFAGGFQGGKTDAWIEAMKEMKKMIDVDLLNGYIPIWNDESIWNRYLLDHKPSIVLTPSYVYPDSLINEYYIPRWGKSYPPKLVTITKKHSLIPLTAPEIAKINIMQK